MTKPAAEGCTHGLVGASAPIVSVRRLIEKAARNRLPVLLLGESGTGKEVVARAIHDANPRGRFVPIDCGSLVGTLMESELFGHVKGAFSGAVENKKGLVEMADGGTAFFDEIGDLPLEMQVKLLRLIQEREFRAVGALQWRKVDLRIIAATHRDLKAEVAAGRFRLDLFYRLNVFVIHLPPLRERTRGYPAADRAFPRSGRGRRTRAVPSRPGHARHAHLLRLARQRPRAEALHGPHGGAALRGRAELRRPSLGIAEPPGALQPGPIVRSGRGRAGPARRLPGTSVPGDFDPGERNRAITAALDATRGERARAAGLLKIEPHHAVSRMKEYGIE